jgi:crossover junction endodeoxyribonuclease RuvC
MARLPKDFILPPTTPNLAHQKKPLILGIDPGFTGALAIYDINSRVLVDLADTPSTVKKDCKSAKAKTIVDVADIALFISAWASQIRGCVIEEVGARPNQGVVSMFNFGFVTGIVHGVVGSFLIPINKTKPFIWKPLMGLTKDKDLSRKKAKELFPSRAADFNRVKDDGRAEAALLAKFGERIFI